VVEVVADFTIVDTDILIDVGRDIDQAIARLHDIERKSSLAVSVITQMELFVGCRNKIELQEVEKFLQRFRVLQMMDTISDVAVDLLRQYRLSHGLLIADALIAATALVYNAPFISKISEITGSYRI